MRWLLVVIIGLVAAFAVYVRLSPAPVSQVHVAPAPQPPGDYPTAGSFTAVRAVTSQPENVMRAVETIAQTTPRTRLVAGSSDTGLMTFETRSRFWGFPDYTTVTILPSDAAGDNEGPLLMIYARLRFGQADLGVNKSRVESWLAQLGPLIVNP